MDRAVGIESAWMKGDCVRRSGLNSEDRILSNKLDITLETRVSADFVWEARHGLFCNFVRGVSVSQGCRPGQYPFVQSSLKGQALLWMPDL